MTKLFDLLLENSDNDKTISSLKKISGGKKPALGKKSGSASNEKKPVGYFVPDSMVFDFVAIDVETTGLDPKNDRIIEIGAVRFSNGNAIKEYSSLVNPGLPLPRNIVQLTGIQDKDVACAPKFESIASAVLEFIADMPLCGHQIEFDINFINAELKRLGKPKILAPEIDTALLSRVVTPSIARYSLKHVSRALGVELSNAHRALADAKASGFVACSLLNKFDGIPLNVRAVLARFSPPSLIKTLLYKSIGANTHTNNFIDVFPLQKPPKKMEQSANPSELPVETIRRIFSNSGRLAEIMKEFIERPSQTRMASCVAEALNTATFLVAEAGTGTGKSLAYLVPSALYASKNDCRIFISTHTKNLQDQLVSKDLPLVKKISGENFRFSVLKGRSNYICVRRYRRLISGELIDLSYRERLGLLPLIRWAQETKTGDIEEQNQFNIKWFSRIWRMVCADAHLCEGKRCPEFNACFLQAARLRALGSHIVVINHALFFSELCSDSSFLGPIGSIVFDEAHHLESCGHRYLRVEADTNRFTQFTETMNQIDKELKKHPDLNAPEIAENDLKSLIKRMRSGIAAFLNDCNAWVATQNPPADEYQLKYPADTLCKLTSYTALMNVFSEFQQFLHQLIQILQPETGQQKTWQQLRPGVCLLSDRTSQLKADLDYLSGANLDDHVFWIEGNRKKGWIKLCGVPLDIGSILSRIWESNNSGCIFTSATLAVSRSLDYFMQKAGLVGSNSAKTRGETFESPFKPEQTLRAAMQNSPEPDSPEYPVYIADTISSLMSAFRKNILVLFTSNAMLEAVYSHCKLLPAMNEITLLAQGITGPRHAVLEEFKNSEQCVLLGADSFWEGIDVPGKACEIVIIPRLPFLVPTHPLTKALSDRMSLKAGESFFSYSVPEAIIKFRQGTGRLIRSPQDRGALIVLDKRIVTKNYGKRFIRSLDGDMNFFSTIDDIIKSLESFFSGKAEEENSGITYTPFEDM